MRFAHAPSRELPLDSLHGLRFGVSLVWGSGILSLESAVPF